MSSTSLSQEQGNEVAEADNSIPLIELPDHENDEELLEATSEELVQALETSGFLLIKSHHLPLALQQQALVATREIFEDGSSSSIITHPTDPKKYIMMDHPSILFPDDDEDNSNDRNNQNKSQQKQILTQYMEALEHVKRQVLTCIAVGLKLPTQDYFVQLHEKNQSVLRLLYYPSPSKTTAATTATGDEEMMSIRCKAHSDYGSITLLLTDDVPGLQAWIGNKWRTVPYVKGALVVNIGSLLSDWTQGKLLATLHRVVAPANSISDDDDRDGIPPPRISMAFFADPDPGISATLSSSATKGPTDGDVASRSSGTTMSVAEYIQWRSGGIGMERSGVAFGGDAETKRLNNPETPKQ